MPANRTYTKKKTAGAPRRRKRRRYHRGRLALVFLIISVVVISAMAIISRSCGLEWSFVRGGGDFRTPVPDAITRGRADARSVLTTEPESMERQNALLDIKAREYRLRQAGHDHAADDYINAANDVLRTNGISDR